MADLIDRQAAIDALGEKPLVWDDLSDFDLGKAAQWSDDVDAIKELPSVQTQSTMGQANEVVQSTKDCISRQAAIDCCRNEWEEEVAERIEALPSAQPEIIRCNVCRHWHQTTGEMKGFGLGDCDYLEKKLVTCNGYCYWAERKEDE